MKTIKRLVDIKTRNAEAAEAAYATANAIAETAEKTRDQARERYFNVVDDKDDTKHIVIASSADLEDRDRQIRFLRRLADDAENKLRACRAKEAEARNMMTEARMERRRYETWLEREVAAAATENRRVERLAEDDVASRKKAATGTSSS
jgi:flagellar biosynthesis chaperone FliJ